jgi:hypothetical protein
MALTVIVLGIVMTLNFSRIMVSSQEAERKKHVDELAARDASERSTTEAIRRVSSQGLAEEALLAPDGVSGG